MLKSQIRIRSEFSKEKDHQSRDIVVVTAIRGLVTCRLFPLGFELIRCVSFLEAVNFDSHIQDIWLHL